VTVLHGSPDTTPIALSMCLYLSLAQLQCPPTSTPTLAWSCDIYCICLLYVFCAPPPTLSCLHKTVYISTFTFQCTLTLFYSLCVSSTLPAHNCLHVHSAAVSLSVLCHLCFTYLPLPASTCLHVHRAAVSLYVFVSVFANVLQSCAKAVNAQLVLHKHHLFCCSPPLVYLLYTTVSPDNSC
jgi:hypothetical protein